MKTQSILLLRGFAVSVLVLAIGASMSCQTAYDAQGRPIQSVDPGVAVAGAVAAGALGYAIANDDNDNHHHGHRRYYSHGRYYYR